MRDNDNKDERDEPKRKRYLRVTAGGWQFGNARIEIRHPLGLYMNFPAKHHNALRLVEFSQECIRDLENQAAVEDWSI